MKIQSTGETIFGRVARYSYDVHQDTRTMHTEIDVPNPTLELKPGMYAQATIVLNRRDGALCVPTQAVSLASGQPNVWIVDSDGRIQQRDVTVGLQTSDWIQVESGLEPGARVLLGDRSALAVGEKVRPKLTNPVEAV
jgi:RND family efflux transporter MFP subunit